MKKLFVILGHTNTKKSSTIRCLCGVSSARSIASKKVISLAKHEVDIHFNKKKNPFAVRTQAPQEYKHEMQDELERKCRNFQFALIALRINEAVHKRKTYPRGEVYIDYFKRKGWKVSIIELCNSGISSGVANAVPVQITDRANNAIAADVRNLWNWT